ncbi:hypothetical protein Tco_0236265 [Tanacetum coccineum]
MMLLARAITKKFSTPINNRLRTSSNTRNQAVIQDGRVDIQSKNVGYAINGNRNGGRQNKNQAANAGNGLKLKMLDVSEQENISSAINKDVQANLHSKVMNYILQAIPNDIYDLVDACKDAQKMWEQIRRFMYGSKKNKHAIHSRLMNEFENFDAKEGESLDYVYERLSTLVNVMDRNDVHPIKVSFNTKFLNSLQLEWSKYVTLIRQNKYLSDVEYDLLYDTLLQFEPHVQASKAKRAAKNHGPLALIAHSSQSHASPSYAHSSQSY